MHPIEQKVYEIILQPHNNSYLFFLFHIDSLKFLHRVDDVIK